MTLVEFLTARLAEDEAEGQRLLAGDYDSHIMDDSARVLREVVAKRKILREHPLYPVQNYDMDVCAQCGSPESYGNDEAWPCPTLRALASVYSDHPDYDEEWAA